MAGVRISGIVSLLFAAAMQPGTAMAQAAASAHTSAHTSASTAVPAFQLPPSSQLSPQARDVLIRMRAATAPAEIAGDIAKRRAFYQGYNDDRLAEMRRHFRTTERRETIDGVTVDIVEPAGGVPERNRDRVLINLHGGAFLWGSGSGALVEAIPIAATMGVRVVTVDYRLAPEHHYPAASQDVEAVYRALLKTYKPGAIGIFGCSAGGVVTAQSTAWLRAAGLPRPGAIGTFCATGAPYSGDWAYLAPATMGEAIPASSTLPATLTSPYMVGVPTSDARAYPLLSEEEIRAMPPTLLLAGGRDFAASALTLAHRRLAAAGVPSQLYLFDGLPHAFFMWPDMPESLEAFRLISTFFNDRLDKGSPTMNPAPNATPNPALNRTRVIIALALTYALLGIMMNSVGVVILQSIRHFDATKPMGSTLEACKDLSVVVASFLLATRVPLLGYRRTLIGAMALMAATCLLASFANGFLAMQALFVMTGLSFGVAKVAVYATIGLLARDPADHASITGIVEGVFMVGLLSGVWIFGAFIASDGTGSEWLRVYWLIGAVCAVIALLWVATPLDESGAVSADHEETAHWGEMLRLALLPASVAVLAGLFLYVLIEQSVGSWLPTFNNQVLHLPAAMSVEMSSIFVGALALGRLASGFVLRHVSWLPALLGCLGGIAVLILVSLPLAEGVQARPIAGWSDAPIAAYLFPLLGLFLAPIYPTLCSVALSAMPRHRHAAMMGLIVIFSALGGTLGSFITGMLFQHLPGALAFYFTLVPIALIALALPLIRRRQAGASAGAAAR